MPAALALASSARVSIEIGALHNNLECNMCVKPVHTFASVVVIHNRGVVTVQMPRASWQTIACAGIMRGGTRGASVEMCSRNAQYLASSSGLRDFNINFISGS